MARLPIPFNNPKTYAGHSGVDYGQPRGTEFKASGPGKVTVLSKNDRGGYYIWIQYDNGPEVGYHHMDNHNGCPWVGSRVWEGTRLGYVGESRTVFYWSTPPFRSRRSRVNRRVLAVLRSDASGRWRKYCRWLHQWRWDVG
jgi:hypothetical protein